MELGTCSSLQGFVAAACEGLGSGKEGSQSFPGSMALAFLDKVILKWPCHILLGGGQLLVMPCPENFGFINRTCTALALVGQGMHLYMPGGGCAHTDKHVRELQHPQEHLARAQTGRVQPQAEMHCRAEACVNTAVVRPAAPGTGGGCPAGQDVAVAPGGDGAVHCTGGTMCSRRGSVCSTGVMCSECGAEWRHGGEMLGTRAPLLPPASPQAGPITGC